MPNYEHNIQSKNYIKPSKLYHEKIYYGTSEDTFKQRYGNHKKSFNHEKHRTEYRTFEGILET